MRFSVVLALVLLSFTSCAEYQKGNHVPVDYFYQPGDHLTRVLAVKDKSLEWFRKLFDTLIDNQKDLNAIIDPATGDTFIHLAIKTGSVNMAQALINAGADVFLANKAGKTSINLIQETSASKPLRRLFAIYTGAQENSSDDEVQMVGHTNRYRRVQEGNGGVGRAAVPITTAAANNNLAHRRIRTVGPEPNQGSTNNQQARLPMNRGFPRFIVDQPQPQPTPQPTAQTSYHQMQQATQQQPVAFARFSTNDPQPLNPSSQLTLASPQPVWTASKATSAPTNQPSQRPQNSLLSIPVNNQHIGAFVCRAPVHLAPSQQSIEIERIRQALNQNSQAISSTAQQLVHLPPRAQPATNQITQAPPRPQVQQTGPAIVNPENLDPSALDLLTDPTLYSPKEKIITEVDDIDPALLIDLLNGGEPNTKTDAPVPIKPVDDPINTATFNSVPTAPNVPSFKFKFPTKLLSAPQNNDKKIEKFFAL